MQSLQDEDARVRFVVADFLLSRASAHKEAAYRAALQQVVALAQGSGAGAGGAVLENPYVQLQAFLRHGLLDIDDL